jgi:hypothetical protein
MHTISSNGSPRLCAINGVEGLVKEKSNSPGRINPARHVLIQRRIVPQERQKVQNHKAEAGKGDLYMGMSEESFPMWMMRHLRHLVF